MISLRDVYNASLTIAFFFFASKEIKPAVRSDYVISQVALTISTLMERVKWSLYCDMTDKEVAQVTVISHDCQNRTLVDGFNDPRSYSRNVTCNETSFLQLASLTASSPHCVQFIMYECYDSVLSYQGTMYVWWVSRNGEKMKYWDGADSVDYKCACGLSNT